MVSNVLRWGGVRFIAIPEDVSWELHIGDYLALRASPMVNGGSVDYVSHSVSSGSDTIGEYTLFEIVGASKVGDVKYTVKVYKGLPVVIPSLTLTSGFSKQPGPEEDVDTSPLRAQVYVDRAFGYTPYCWVRPTFIKLKEARGPVVLGSFTMLIDSQTMGTIAASALEPRAPQLVKVTPGTSPSITLGLSGTVAEVPQGYTVSALVVYGDGPGAALERWGSSIRSIYGRRRSIELYRDLIDSLQYWTDTGGMYWYRTLPGKNFGETMLEIKRYMDESGIGVKYYQVDSWWYPKSVEDGGALEYREVPELGMSLRELSDKLGPLISLHVRYVSKASPYAQKYQSVTAPNATCIMEPERYFDDLLSYLKSSGVVSVKHDWLTTIRQRCRDAYMTRVGLLERYLDSLFAAAEKHGMLVELCMPDLYHYFIGAKHDRALMIRTSPDYGDALPKHYLLYINAYVAMLALQLGYAPFFDVFVTTNNHAYADMLARAIFYSPIGIGDAIDKDPYWRRGVNVALLRRFFTPQWRLLRPSEPARLIDEMYVKDPYIEPIPLVAYTKASGIPVIVAFNVNRDLENVCYVITPRDVGLSNGAAFYRVNTRTIHVNSVEGCVRRGEPHVILAIEDVNRPRILGLVNYAIPPVSILELSDEYVISQYRANVKLPEPGSLVIYSPRRPRSVLVDGSGLTFSYVEEGRVVIVDVPKAEFVIVLNY